MGVKLTLQMCVNCAIAVSFFSKRPLEDTHSHTFAVRCSGNLFTASPTCLARPNVPPHPSASCFWPRSPPAECPCVSWWRAASRLPPSALYRPPRPQSVAPQTWRPSRQLSSSSRMKPCCEKRGKSAGRRCAVQRNHCDFYFETTQSLRSRSIRMLLMLSCTTTLTDVTKGYT